MCWEKIPINTETALWPYEPGILHEPLARELLGKLRDGLDDIPFDTFRTPAEVGRWLGARVVLAQLSPPRQGWTWFKQEDGRLIEVASWLLEYLRPVVVAHEVCHVILGPPPEMHDRITERVCNWGAGEILRRIDEAESR